MRIPKTNIEFNPPVYMCKKAKTPFILNGKVENKEFWDNAQFTEYFIDIQGKQMTTPRFKTRVKMLWDNENMYFGAVLEGGEIWATLTERDSIIYQDNDFEIFIDPNSDTHEYYEFEINALNTVWDLLLTMPYRDGGRAVNAFDIQGLQTAIYIDGEINEVNPKNKKWSVEVAIPFSVLRQCDEDFNQNPKPSDYYRVNFSRVHWQVEEFNGKYKKKINTKTNLPYPEDNWVWSASGLINVHYPETWGFVFFVEDKEVYEIPRDEYIKWELRRLYYKQHEYFDLYGKFTTSFEKLSNEWKFTINPKIEITQNNFEMCAKADDGIKDIIIFANGRTIIK